MPGGGTLHCQYAHHQWGGVNHADLTFPRKRREHASISVVTRLYLQYDRIVSTSTSFSDAAKHVQRITSYPYKARLTLLLQTPHLWNCSPMI